MLFSDYFDSFQPFFSSVSFGAFPLQFYQLHAQNSGMSLSAGKISSSFIEK